MIALSSSNQCCSSCYPIVDTYNIGRHHSLVHQYISAEQGSLGLAGQATGTEPDLYPRSWLLWLGFVREEK